MAKTFHCFPHLPRELRDMVWEAAMRPDLPGAHFLTAFDPNASKATFPGHCLTASASPDNEPDFSRPLNLGLAAPSVDAGRRDFSTYTIDAQLWAVCREAREAVQRRFKIKGSVWAHDASQPCATVGFYRPAHGPQYSCVVYPDRDLFCLDPVRTGDLCADDASDSDNDNDNGNLSFMDHPAWKACHLGIGVESLRAQAQHWKADEDPMPGPTRWIYRELGTRSDRQKYIWVLSGDMRQRTPEGLAEHLASLPQRERERQLQPKDRRQFYGNGCVFKEARASDQEWVGSPDAFTIAWKLRQLQKALLSARPSGPGETFAVKVGVMGVESIDGSI